MTASSAHRRRPSPSLTPGADHDTPAGPARPVEAVPAVVREPHLLRTVVPAEPSRASVVRRAVAAHLTLLRLTPEQLDDAVLATDELFANAVRHGSSDSGDTVTVIVERTGHDVRVTVADRSPAVPRFRTADAAEECGRGLAIVAAVSDDWGVALPAPGATGKSVWFTLALQEPS
ncbi:ATP-binding protein [Streptomyces sp. HC44]|uniref:ATP-binding protein n=1 Tax=Streptomyces scabichelini TaxID=2711217 RepID=A0A6G4UZY0_9ACTN|nr:ATP-binding protein [Streptomyces scabichelini]NGO07193.1 ATP-binding protein [Streptomyces scabichelini]